MVDADAIDAITIREAENRDLPGVLALYAQPDLDDGKVLPATLRLLCQAERSEMPMVRALAAVEKVAAEVQEELLAVVHTAKPLGPTEITRLTQALGKAYDATVHLHIVEDPSLIGGLRIEIGDDVIDGSVASKLDIARRRIAG